MHCQLWGGHAWLHANFECFPPSHLEGCMGLGCSYGKLILCTLYGSNLAGCVLPHHESHGLKLGHPCFLWEIVNVAQGWEWGIKWMHPNSMKCNWKDLWNINYAQGLGDVVPNYPWMSPHFVPHLETCEIHAFYTPVDWDALSLANKYWKPCWGWWFLCLKTIICFLILGGNPMESLKPHHNTMWNSSLQMHISLESC